MPPNRPISRTLPRQPLRLRHSLASRAVNGRALTRLPHNKFMRKLAGWSAIFATLCPNDPNTCWRLFSRQSRLAASHHYPWQAPRRNVIPGFAGAKPGTGQTARAIIAPASCRHDNCSAHCLIIVRLSDLASRLLTQARPLRGFTSPLSGLCLPGTRQVRLYITKRYANLPGVMMTRTPLTRLPP